MFNVIGRSVYRFLWRRWKANIGLNHSPDSIEAMQYIANFFVTDARRNNHTFADRTLATTYSMYNFQTYYEGDILDGYQAYLFDF
jgi:hypothetical protein